MSQTNKSCPCKEFGASGACSSAVERMHTMQAEPKKPEPDVGCCWYINSAEHNYSWWTYVKTLDESLSDKEIAQLLGITVQQVAEAYNSAIKKLKVLRNTPEVQEFLETVMDIAANKVDEVNEYADSDETAAIAALVKQNEKLEDVPDDKMDKPKKLKRGLGMPLHRDGRKTDLYFAKPKKK